MINNKKLQVKLKMSLQGLDKRTQLLGNLREKSWNISKIRKLFPLKLKLSSSTKLSPNSSSAGPSFARVSPAKSKNAHKHKQANKRSSSISKNLNSISTSKENKGQAETLVCSRYSLVNLKTRKTRKIFLRLSEFFANCSKFIESKSKISLVNYIKYSYLLVCQRKSIQKSRKTQKTQGQRFSFSKIRNDQSTWGQRNLGLGPLLRRLPLDQEQLKIKASQKRQGEKKLPLQRQNLLSRQRSLIRYQKFCQQVKSLDQESGSRGRSGGRTLTRTLKGLEPKFDFDLEAGTKAKFLSASALIFSQISKPKKCLSRGNWNLSLNNQNTQTLVLRAKSRYQSAQFLANYFGWKLQRRSRVTSLMTQVLKHGFRRSFIRGIRISCSGRINGQDKAKTIVKMIGKTPLQVFRARVDYGTKEIITKYGVFGIKVWVCY